MMLYNEVTVGVFESLGSQKYFLAVTWHHDVE